MVCRSRSHSVTMPPIQQSYRLGYPSTTSWIMASNSHAVKSNCLFFVQVHAWVTDMSLKGKRLQPWQTLTHHPLATVPIRRSKRTQTDISNLQNRKRSSGPGASKPAVSQPGNKAAAGTLITVDALAPRSSPCKSLCMQMHHPCCLTHHLPFRMDWTRKLLLSKQLQSSRLDTYFLSLLWGPAGQFSMLGAITIPLQLHKE